VVGGTDAIVEVGVVGVVVGVEAGGVEELLEDEPLVAGAGETIATVDVEPDDEPDGDDVAAAVVDVDEDAVLADAGLELSLGTALANGSRAILASTTLTGSGDAVVLVVVVCALVAVAAGGAGTVGVVLAEARLSRNTGTATTATTRIATTIHSLRSTRSRRSELILVLRSWCQPGWPTGRWWR
jgi:hypothetical protein